MSTLSQDEITDLKNRLQEAEDTLQAIRSGAIDAIVVEGSNDQQIFTLKSADFTYRMLIESMNQGALTISQDGTILYSNKKFSEMINTPLEHLIGSFIQSWLYPRDFIKLKRLMSGQGDVIQNLKLKGSYKSSITVMISATHLPSSNETAAYMSIVVTDMTEHKKAQDAKDEFITLASHQLRTPATGVKQYLGMILEGYAGKLSNKNRVFIKTAYDSNERQLTIINDILKTAEIDSGIYALKKSQQLLVPIMEEVMKEYSSIFAIRKQKFESNLDSSISAFVDPREIRLVISNLIENASKYSPPNTNIKVELLKNDQTVKIVVTDQGVGILESDKSQIFDKFTRINNSLSDTVNGSGLGLYWAKRITELHDGWIDVSSVINKGSSFTINLPL